MGLYEGILGIQRDYEGLRIQPCLPLDWESAEVTRQFRGAAYHIVIRRGIKKGITIDGERLQGDLIACHADHLTHDVIVTV